MSNSTVQGNLKISIWHGQEIHITDCTNAGKRGKKCTEFTIRANCADMNARYQTILDLTHNNPIKIADVNTPELLTAFVNFCRLNADANVYERTMRGVDVVPVDCPTLGWSNALCAVSVELGNFYIQDLTDKYNEPRIIPSHGASKMALAKFYRAFAELSKGFNEHTKAYGISQLAWDMGVSCHSYCAMD
jgi:hypothetical protein